MPNPNPPTFFEKLRGKRFGNIELEPEGPKDPNLPPSTAEQLGKAAKNFKAMQSKAALEGLYDAAGIKK